MKDIKIVENAIDVERKDQARIAELEAQQQWISFANEKPDPNECVDVWLSVQDIDARVCNCFYNPKNNKFWYWRGNNKTQIYASDVTHWMPLPKPPEE